MTHPTRAFSGSIINRFTGSKILARVGQISVAFPDVECSFFKEYFNDEIKGLYHKKAVLEWCKTHDASVLRPIFKWSAQEVIDYILDNGQRPNPLYERGFARVGCFPCIMCRKREVQLISKDKWAEQRLIDAEQRMKEETERGSSFFHPVTFPPASALTGNIQRCKRYSSM